MMIIALYLKHTISYI